MSELIQKSISILFALLTAYAWDWTGFFREEGVINSLQQRWVQIALTVILAVQQVYLVMSKPGNKMLIEARREVMEYYLNELLIDYYEYLEDELLAANPDKNGNPDTYTLPAIRINIMLPTKKNIFLPAYLRIAYVACPKEWSYSGRELSLTWKKGNGTCGTAWKEGHVSVFDSQIPELKLPDNSLNKEQKEICGRINSTLSVPLYYNNTIVGIINMDSLHQIGETRFTEVERIARNYAEAMAGLLPEAGVII